MLRKDGLANVRILVGGITGWEAFELTFNRGTQRWDSERPVRLATGLTVALSLLLSVFCSCVDWPLSRSESA